MTKDVTLKLHLQDVLLPNWAARSVCRVTVNSATQSQQNAVNLALTVLNIVQKVRMERPIVQPLR